MPGRHADRHPPAVGLDHLPAASKPLSKVPPDWPGWLVLIGLAIAVVAWLRKRPGS